MIQSAMMFALGFFLCGLFGLAFLSAFARRTRRVAEQRLLKRLASHRSEFDAEMAAMRAQHAVYARKLERETGAMRDMATAYRLDSDLKDHEVASARADLTVKVQEVEELTNQLQALRNDHLAVERQLAEYGSTLRSARHALDIELDKRGQLQQALDRALGMVDGRLIEIKAMRAESDALRSIAEQLRPGSTTSIGRVVPSEMEPIQRPSLTPAAQATVAPPVAPSPAQIPVVPPNVQPTGSEPMMPAVDHRTEPAFAQPVVAAAQSPVANDQEASAIQNVAEEIRRLTEEAQSDLPRVSDTTNTSNVVPIPSIEPSDGRTQAPAVTLDQNAAGGAVPPGSANDSNSIAPTKREGRRKLTKRGMKSRNGAAEPAAPQQADQSADARFQEAMNEIRALGQAAGGRQAPGK